VTDSLAHRCILIAARFHRRKIFMVLLSEVRPASRESWWPVIQARDRAATPPAARQRLLAPSGASSIRNSARRACVARASGKRIEPMGRRRPMNVERAVVARAERHRINETRHSRLLADVVQLPRKSVRRLTPRALLEEPFKKASCTFLE
jgi:hypothetical protein